MELTDIQIRLRESIAESGIAQKELARQVGGYRRRRSPNT